MFVWPYAKTLDWSNQFRHLPYEERMKKISKLVRFHLDYL